MSARIDSTWKARQIAEYLLSLRASPSAAELPVPQSRATRAVIDYPRLQRHIRWFDGLLRLYRAAARAVADQVITAHPEDSPESGPENGPEGIDPESDRLLEIVRRAHRILLEHPVAAKAAYAALAEQGRVFGATREGSELRARLTRSRRLRRASLLWRALTMGMLDDQDPGELPSTYLDNLLRVVDREDLEQLLGKLHLRRSGS